MKKEVRKSWKPRLYKALHSPLKSKAVMASVNASAKLESYEDGQIPPAE